MARDADAVPGLLRTRLGNIPGIWAIAYQNQLASYTPNIAVPFIEEFFVFGAEFDTSHGGTARYRQYDESYQLLLCVPSGSGILTARTMASTIRTAFLNPSFTLPSGASLNVKSVAVQPPRIVSSWLKLPVVISYTFTTNA